MIHQVQVIFYLSQPLVFERSQDANKIQKGKSINLSVLVDRDKLVFMESYQNPLCKLYLSPYTVKVNKEGNQLEINHVLPEPTRSHSKQKTDRHQKHQKQQKLQKKVQIIATIKASRICIQQILQACPQKKYKSCLSFVPSNVQHISILSGESPVQRFRGFINLGGIMFLILNIRNIIDNFLGYGIRFQAAPFQFVPISSMIAYSGLIIFVQVAYHLQKLRFTRVLSQKIVVFFLILNQILLVIYNVMFCKVLDGHPLTSALFTMLCMVLLLKFISYMQVNSELFLILKRLYKLKQKQFNEFMFAHHEISQANLRIIKENRTNWQCLVSHKRLYYFLFAPTLCYQLQYPRTSSIRYVWVAKRFVQFLIMGGFQMLLWVQYIQPQLEGWFAVIKTGEYTYIEILYRWLKLSIPNTIMWITGFYSFFHVFLNISAQLLKFADRKFYMDWWNCRSLQEYWKTWNLPVHFWFIRHLYNPLLQKGLSKTAAMLIVFLISAIAHEFAVCAPLNLVTYYAFLAMLMQAPAIFLQKKITSLLHLKNSQLGNVSFWLFFCILGQPVCVFIYYALYMSKMQGAHAIHITDITNL